VQYRAHEVDTRAPDWLRFEEIMHLQLDASIFAHSHSLCRGNNLREFLKYKPAGILRYTGPEILQDLAGASADVYKG
jgi:hypothetical protein